MMIFTVIYDKLQLRILHFKACKDKLIVGKQKLIS